ncbi:hypothetical protein GGQ74_001135 [Desulfobaculum xiamenense]|uniref:Uncharacterized protein n=1 Tax=Desulfobaculum xiamenense TaxID=995050 RepID=A0A846QQ15_9BACT|nr:hypothetical protein [Desulfobaculum xiamenense]NJB67495.1 hypothetical protein [Desulfobaculum xiamenense]
MMQINTGSLYFWGAIFLLVALFLLLREFLCWYWKINERISNQHEIIHILTAMNPKVPRPPVAAPNDDVSGKNIYDLTPESRHSK